MPLKLLGVLSTAKGAAVAAVIVAAASTTALVATNPDAQQAVQNAVQQVTQPTSGECPRLSGERKPEVVDARNVYDKALRDTFRDYQQVLEKLRSTKAEVADRERLNELVKTAEEKLRARQTRALNEIAALTLGREGQAEASGSTGANPAGTPCDRAEGARARPAGVDDVLKVAGIVDAATGDMKAVVDDALKAATQLTSGPRKPSDAPGAKPADKPEQAKPTNPPGGKPTDTPGGKPSPGPAR